MSRLSDCFAELKRASKTALIPYVTAGDPNPSVTVPLMHAMVEAGADVIELGIPFSDPMADGPVIQLATERALAHGVTLSHVLDMVSEFRNTNSTTPIVLMGYVNPYEIMGYEVFAEKASAAGVDGVLIVDLPPEEAGDVVPVFKKAQLDPIFLLSPTSTAQRIQMITEKASGFVYYVALKGVTGAASLDVSEVSTRLSLIREHTDMPLGVGFGISDAESAQKVSSIADAVIVGSALVKCIAANEHDSAAIQSSITELLSSMRAAMDGV